MLTSMTGFGRGESQHTAESGVQVTITVEIRSVNSRFIEISLRSPRTLSDRELELREAIRKRLERGKISLSISIERQGTETIPLSINEPLARAYFNLLDKLRTLTGLTAEIQLRDLTSFGDIFQGEDNNSAQAEEEWKLTQQALDLAITDLTKMREQEGRELEKDLRA